MNQTVTLLLLAATGGKLTFEERQALATFQTREKVTLVAPRTGHAGLSGGEAAYVTSPTVWVRGVSTAPMRRAALDDVAARIEASLDEAQTLAASLDEERALVLLVEV